MTDQRTDEMTADLPEGTDTVIEGAASTGEDSAENTTTREDSERGLVDRIRGGREQLSNQAGERARGLVTQGLDRTSEALANVSKMIGDTASGIDERLGEEYGDYARKAASALEEAANKVSAKNPDELIDDTREFVRKSPGVALAGAAIIGFALVRLVKSGLDQGRNDDED